MYTLRRPSPRPPQTWVHGIREDALRLELAKLGELASYVDRPLRRCSWHSRLRLRVFGVCIRRRRRRRRFFFAPPLPIRLGEPLLLEVLVTPNLLNLDLAGVIGSLPRRLRILEYIHTGMRLVGR